MGHGCTAVLLLVCAACSSDPPEGRFACDTDADCPSTWVCECARCYATAGGGGGCVDGGGVDAGLDSGSGDDCNDRVDCTVDVMTSDGCTNTPDDTRCAVSECASGSCNAERGCEYVNDHTMCDDSDPCTVDLCEGPSGCTNRLADDGTPCDDDVFCNGSDACAGGTCVSGTGDPCPGITCDEDMDTCTGCIEDGDCPMPTMTAWSTCTFPATDPCTTAGEQQRIVTSYTCNVGSGTCVNGSSSESRPCTRNTDGSPCATDRNPCTEDVCGGGTCTHPTSPDNTVCGAPTNQFRCCGGSCRDLYEDDQHCGACGVACRSSTDCRESDIGSGARGGSCHGCASLTDCPSSGTDWMCEQRGGSGPFRCECRTNAVCRAYSGSVARCGDRAVQVCRPQ